MVISHSRKQSQTSPIANLVLGFCAQDKAEAKLKVLENRTEEQRKAKAAADADWRRQQRERELQRLKVSRDLGF